MGEGLNMEMLIKKTLEEEDEDSDGIVERLAERIARTRRGERVGRPQALKRHETT